MYLNKILIVSSFIMLLISGCSSSNIQSDQRADLGKALWITDSKVWPVADSLMYGDIPAPAFRKEFTGKPGIKSATLCITAAGYYSASINGKKIGLNYLDPAWTNFSKRVYYAEYDLTSDITQGKNCIGVTLGNGFYNPLPMKLWGKYNLRDALPNGKPELIARLKIEYNNGETEEVVTDKSWKYSYGPILKNNVYLGEVYDAGKEIANWNMAGFNDSNWEKSVEDSGPGGHLEKAFFPHIQITHTHKPVSITSTEKGDYIADLGVNFTGLYKIRLKGQPGDTITFRFGERIYDDGTLNPMTAVCGQIKSGQGGPGAPYVAWQTDRFIFGDNGEAWFSPQFTFHIYRYMEISGLKYKPDISDIEGIAFNTNVDDSNVFNCSSELINSIQEAAKRTFQNNLISVQSDCAGREKFGYGGDLNATSNSFICNFDMHSFYRKALYDYVDAMSDSVFIDTAPFVGIKYCGISWESAFITTQYKLYLYYNDTDIVKELYNLDLKWMEKAEKLHPEGIVRKGLADHESLEKVPVELIGTTHYLFCAQIMKTFAGLMNDKVNEEKFSKLADRLSGLVLDNFWKKPVAGPINKQTLFSSLLYYDIIPETEKKAAVDSLIKAVKQGPAGHFTTGIFGTEYSLETLSANGNANTVFDIVNSTEYPGWGYMISHGATTIWETWKESDNIYSNCHPMFGSVSGWLYQWLGGIKPDPANPGFKKFKISPYIPADLSYVNCSYKSPYGGITSNWEKSKDGIRFDITVPENSSASFSVSVKQGSVVTIENIGNKEIVSKKVSDPVFEAELPEGHYTIKY
ncbi:MAG TPA: family 78 glycoside hydrolase catalytic domain [Bacteroidales bacterium]|nr:family 78 glycoside hydrolase catalytic domain [Bacteroidales bacterium]HPT20796.1 family 78 glycoside hydrolase catalytic domain [Bacteroidales bacterium]